MTAQDRTEIRQMLIDILSGQTEEMKGRYNVIHVNLTQIKEQTTKTNGRVSALEKEVEKLKLSEAEHVLSCPNDEKIRALQDNELSKKSIVRFFILSTAVAGTIVGIIATIIGLIIK